MSQSQVPEANRSYYFGTFKLDADRRELLQDGQPLHLRAREFDILLFLVENAGQFVTKDQLIDRVWPTTTVSDANIRVQIAALRRVLGDGRDSARYIVNAAGRGYSFCCPLELPAAVQVRPVRAGTPGDVRYNLPVRLKSILGRGEASNRLISHLPHHRLVTIVGPGGIGKTTLALTVAEELIDAYDDGVRFVDLAGLTDPDLVSSAMAATVGPMKSANPEDELIKFLEDKQILFILDNCEHLIEAAATLVERVLTRTRDIHFLATSREPLRIDGEWLFRLGPLDIPPRKADLTAAEALAYPTVKLFVERARLSDSQFELADIHATTVAELCRRLDGNPLAVELAAARVGLFGIPGLASQLEESFGMLTQGRRTALPRHQTLRATLDWSYEILSPGEQALLYRLSIFRGEFTLATARAVAGKAAGAEHEIIEGLAELTAKSLINVDVSQQPARYRMLFITRDYALQKLRDSGELNAISRRHAEAYLDLLTVTDESERDAHAQAWIEDIRVAIDWAFSRDGDTLLGMQLTRSSIDFGTKLSLLPEYGSRIDKALERVSELDPPQPLIEMRLLIERAHIVQHTAGDNAQIHRLADKALPIARAIFDETGDDTGIYEVLGLRFGLLFGQGRYPEMMKIVEEARTLYLPEGDPFSVNVTMDRMLGQANFFMGNHLASLVIIQKVLSLPEQMIRSRRYIPGDRNNPQITLRVFQARNYWILGEPEKASLIGEEAFAMSEANGLLRCYALGLALIPIAIWRGDIALAKTHIDLMHELAQRNGLGYWLGWAANFKSILAAIENDYAEADEPARPFQSFDIEPLQLDQVGTFHNSLAGPEVFRRVDEAEVGWNAPEILRAHGETLLSVGLATPQAAENLFLRSLDTARRQKALSWQLRTATSLGRLWGYQGRVDEARDLLAGTLSLFTEGFGDSDFIAGEALLKDLSQRTSAGLAK